MAGLLTSCVDLFETKDLYEILSITKSASETEIKRAYHKLSLKVHPDKVKARERKQATEKFQVLGKIYSILSDKDKKAVYDETGEIDDDDDINKDRDWTQYWRLIFAKISVDDIKAFEKTYKGSEEELNDLKQAYLDTNGNMEEIVNSIMCATIDDEPRFREIIQEQIDNGELPEKKNFVNDTQENKKARRKKADKEAKEAEELAEELGITKLDSSKNSLVALIQNNKAAREKASNQFLTDLEAKYSQPKKKTKLEASTSNQKTKTTKGRKTKK